MAARTPLTEAKQPPKHRDSRPSRPTDRIGWQNVPGRARTCNLRLRRPTRYPIVPRGPYAPATLISAGNLSTIGGKAVQFSGDALMRARAS